MHKRIGIIIGKVYKEINRQQLQGILEEAYMYGISALVFTINDESNLTNVATGEINLLNMINFSVLDGIIYLPYTFASSAYCNYIQRFLQEQCPLPVVCIGNEQDAFTAMWHHDRAEMAEMTRHLIQIHGCRRLFCLTGQDFQQVSHERAAGFMEAMTEAGLPVQDKDVIFGDFWVYSAQTLAKEISDGLRPLPDAVVCANDIMATSLCDALAEHGIHVPEDVRVTGYDGSPESAFHVPPITTYCTSWRQLGRNAYCCLHNRLNNQHITPPVTLFSAIHFQDRCFGYMTLLLNGIADGYNTHYLRFCREVTNALEFLRVQNELRSLAYHNLLTQIRDTMTGLYNLRSLPHIWDDYKQTAYEQRFWIGLSINGLYRLTETKGSLQKDKLLVAFAEQLQNMCCQGEKCLRAGEGDFVILGSEPSTSHYHTLLIQNIKEQFEQYMRTLGLPLLPLQCATELGDALPTDASHAEKAALCLLQKARSSQSTYSEQLHYADLAELRRNIYKYPEKNWSLATCSAKLSISTSYFQRIYQKAFGVSCASDIHRSKLKHAKHLLLHTSNTLQEISRKCGYDYSHFMRTFKKEFGLTPTEYRRGAMGRRQ